MEPSKPRTPAPATPVCSRVAADWRGRAKKNANRLLFDLHPPVDPTSLQLLGFFARARTDKTQNLGPILRGYDAKPRRASFCLPPPLCCVRIEALGVCYRVLFPYSYTFFSNHPNATVPVGTPQQRMIPIHVYLSFWLRKSLLSISSGLLPVVHQPTFVQSCMQNSTFTDQDRMEKVRRKDSGKPCTFGNH